MAKKNWATWWIRAKKHSKLFIFLSKGTYNNYKNLLKNVKLPKNPEILELGCGSGIITLWLLKEYGGKATIVDYSRESLKFSKELYSKNKMKVKLVNEDITRLKLKKKYDLVHSQGLIEHFKGERQNMIIKKHWEFLKKNGIALITAPRPSIYYKMWRGVVEKVKGEWPFGYEKPISAKNGIRLLEKNGLKTIYCKKFIIETGYICKRI